ncbi:MAG: aminotransferase class I/II-fold pyridoxal phosphate-dependent enzyme, partial [Hyphomicrobiales bacterium]
MSKIEDVARTIEDAINDNLLKPGERLSSVRTAADQYHVSKNTIVEAYSRLSARQLIIAKHGSGFFVADRSGLDQDKEEAVVEAYDRMSLLRAQLTQQFSIRPGDGRPPPSWMNSALPKRINADSLFDKESDQGGYGNPLGHGQLREMIARRFATQGAPVSPNQIVTTFGANHALDLIIRRFLTQGQTVLVDDPGYYPLIAKLKLAKIKVIGVPRIHNGPDLGKLRQLSEE